MKQPQKFDMLAGCRTWYRHSINLMLSHIQSVFFFLRELAVPFTGHSLPRQDKVNAYRSRFHCLFYRLFLCLVHMACDKWGEHDDLRNLHAKDHYFLFLFVCSRVGLDLWPMRGPYRPQKNGDPLPVFL